MTSRDGRAGLALLEARLEAFREYAELVEAQDAAVEAGELDEAARLGGLRNEMQRRLEEGGDLSATGLGSIPGPPDEPRGSTEDEALARRAQLEVVDGGEAIRGRARQVQEETYRVLLQAARVHQRMTRRLESLREDTGSEQGEVDRGRSGMRSYTQRPSRRDGLNIRF